MTTAAKSDLHALRQLRPRGRLGDRFRIHRGDSRGGAGGTRPVNVWPLGRTRALRSIGVVCRRGDDLRRGVDGLSVHACFGSPFHIAYSSEQAGFEGMQTGVFGISFAERRRVSQILFGCYRGLLPLAPVLIFAPLGWVAMIRWVRLSRTPRTSSVRARRALPRSSPRITSC